MSLYDLLDDFGYTIVGEAEDLDLGYEFDTFLVAEKDGRYFWDTDSGCSCWSPFEMHEIDDMTEATPVEILKALDEWKEERSRIGDESLRVALMDARPLERAA